MQSNTSNQTTRVLVPTGALGISFAAPAFARGVESKPDVICVDGGSTDSGPYYLGTGTSKYSRAVTKAEWRELMIARDKAQVPLVIGTCGTCGADASVDWMLSITREIAEELGQTVKVAALYSSQPIERVQGALKAGRVTPLVPAPEVSEESLAECTNIVALAGAEQIGAALDTGADIVLAGRATDTAIVSALSLRRGDHAGAAWHGAKIAECGALCSTDPTSGVILLDIDREGFTVEPMADDANCTPHSVSAHMLYENSDPFILYEPGGHLDVTEAKYVSLDARRVRVTGSQWVPSDRYTVKLEGARIGGYQTTIMAVLRDERYVANAREWTEKLHRFVCREIESRMRLAAEDYDLEFRLIGVDSVLGALETKPSNPAEVGVLGVITASSAEIASEIGKLINPYVLHYPLTRDEELPTFAFPYSPAQSERGALYEFCLNHVMTLDDPMEAFRLEVVEVGHG
ncbi:MAG: acyclic terpene utilization AtuA family protein [Alphaproteobacteria bacterium]|nr:acyclic terpene utilization AtuA family protein [Alphaproteobacteria bacterium]